jgi:ABC-2 type transport system ATP-binding protein
VVRFRLPEGTAPPEDLGVRPSGGDGTFEGEPADLTTALHRLTGWAIDRGVELEALQIVRPSLEDVYLQLTEGPVTMDQEEGPKRRLRVGRP